MSILVLAATKLEIEAILNQQTGIDVLITGVGQIPACYYLAQGLAENNYDLIIQAGVAGSFSEQNPPGSVVMVSQDCFGDLGMEEQNVFLPIFNTPFADADEFPFENGWLVNNFKVAGSEHLTKVKAVTVNKITDNILQKEQLLNHFDPAIETMEGAAFHYVALQKNIPFIQLRSISNYVGERNRSVWKMQEALANLETELHNIIEKNRPAKQ